MQRERKFPNEIFELKRRWNGNVQAMAEDYHEALLALEAIDKSIIRNNGLIGLPEAALVRALLQKARWRA